MGMGEEGESKFKAEVGRRSFERVSLANRRFKNGDATVIANRYHFSLDLRFKAKTNLRLSEAPCVSFPFAIFLLSVPRSFEVARAFRPYLSLD